MYKQHGNALFLILIAVALFAALSYAVTQTTRGGGNVNKETMTLKTAAISQYISSIQQALMRVQVLSACSEDDISFASSQWGHTDYTHAPASSTNCQIFNELGGGASFQRIDAALLDPAHAAEARYGDYMFAGNLNINGKGAFVSELTMVIPYLTKEACEELHTQFGETGGAARYSANWSVTNGASLFNGDYNSGHVFGSAAWGDSHCMDTGTDPGGKYMFYIILITR